MIQIIVALAFALGLAGCATAQPYGLASPQTDKENDPRFVDTTYVIRQQPIVLDGRWDAVSGSATGSFTISQHGGRWTATGKMTSSRQYHNGVPVEAKVTLWGTFTGGSTLEFTSQRYDSVFGSNAYLPGTGQLQISPDGNVIEGDGSIPGERINFHIKFTRSRQP